MTIPEVPETAVINEAKNLWGLPLQPAGCPKCGRAYLVEVSRLGQICPGCASAHLESQPIRMRLEPPELLIPFQKQPVDLRSILDRFVKPVWLRQPDFNLGQLLQRITPIYWPMWLVDSDLTGSWQAEMGYDYRVKSSQESYTQDGWKTQEQIETRIRWEPRVGQLKRHYDNVVVSALDEAQALTGIIGATRRESVLPYDPSAIGQTSIRIPDLHPENAWPSAQTAFHQAAGEECCQAAQAQHLRNFNLETTYDNLHWTLLLQPLYATYYFNEKDQPQIVLVNGQSGVIGGPRYASQKKGCLLSAIGLGISAFMVMVYLLLVILGRNYPELSSLAVVSLCIALGMGFLSIIPTAWPWQWNRHQHTSE